MPSLEQVWHQYLRRFAVDHWNRFAKQRLHWTIPKLGTTEQGQRWSDLMPLMSWQLWLAREIVTDKPLPAAEVCGGGFPDSRTGGSSQRRSFSRDWYSCSCAQTSRKVCWLAKAIAC